MTPELVGPIGVSGFALGCFVAGAGDLLFGPLIAGSGLGILLCIGIARMQR